MTLKPSLNVWKNTVGCEVCSSSWHASDPELIGARATGICPQCKRDFELGELTGETAKQLRKKGALTDLILKRYVEEYLANRKQKAVRI